MFSTQFKMCKTFFKNFSSKKFLAKNLLRISVNFSNCLHRLSRHNNGIKIETSENTKVTKAHKEDIPKFEIKKGDKKSADKKGGDNPRKFELYFKFQGYLNNIHSHQTLAINRGENLKVFL